MHFKNYPTTQHIITCGVFWMSLFASDLSAQSKPLELTFEQSMQRLRQENLSLKIAGKQIETAESEHRRIQSFWYPALNVSGAYFHMSNQIEVKEPLKQFTDPVKDFVHSIIPDDKIISAILDKVGSYSLRFPLAPQNISTVDANLTWPIFTGGKRIYAGRISRSMISIAEESFRQVDASTQIMLVESYFAVRLGQQVTQVREQTFRALEKHYQNALRLEANGMIDKAERLFVQVNMDEARRELESARNDLNVAQKALTTLIRLDSGEVNPVSPLFINDTLPAAAHFRGMVGDNNYTVHQLNIQEEIAENQLRIGKTGYAPNIALMGKQTLYAHGIQKNLLPRTFIGVGLTWNLFDGLDREHKLRQAKLLKQTVSISRDKAIEDIGVGIDKFYSQMRNAISSVTALNTTIGLSRELVRIRKKAFAEGMATSTEVVDAEVMLSKVEIASLLAFYQYDVALINLLAACGIPDAFNSYSKQGRTEHFIFNP